jgi:hypothetical protein
MSDFATISTQGRDGRQFRVGSTNLATITSTLDATRSQGMSIDYIVTVHVGFSVNLGRVYEEQKVQVSDNCEHPHTAKDIGKHCRECGQEFYDSRTETSRSLKPEIQNAILAKYRDFDKLENGMVSLASGFGYSIGKLSGQMIELYQVGEGEECEYAVVGVHVDDIDVHQEIIRSAKMPRITQESLAKFLAKRKIPVDQKSFGIHTMVCRC